MKNQSSMPTVTEAIAHIQSKRKHIRPNVGFMEQLGIYERAKCDVQADNKEYSEWKSKRDVEFSKMQDSTVTATT